jgi:hypothetical protein
VVVDLVETERGLNPGIFNAAIPSAIHVEQAAMAEQQVKDLLKGGKAFSASGHWNLCNSRIGNAGVMLKAHKWRQLEVNEDSMLKVLDKMTQANVKALEKVQCALEKYTVDGNSLSDKDGGMVPDGCFP